MEFTPERKAEFEKVVKRYPVKRAALLPALRLAQEQEGWLHRDALAYVAGLLELTLAQVHDTASFYTMFRLQPEGQTTIEICTTLSCALGGADGLLERTCKKLGIEPHGTTKDGKFTVKPVECLAACGGAPAVQVNGEWLEQAKDADIDRVLAGERVYRKFDWPKSPESQLFLFKNVWKKDSRKIDTYKAAGGYANLKKYLSLKPEEIVDTVKKSSLRGRGGAGFPTGMKWGFLPKDNPKPRYLCVNADESEPGTYKDRVILENDPHQLVEATVISTYAIGSKTAYIYIRGEFHEGYRSIQGAVEEAYAAGLVGKNILGTGVDVDVHVHRGAGSYECGEETALIESLEGKRGQPRLKPPFPAAVGVFGCPTIVNNVETLACVPLILEKGAEWFASMGTEKNGGPKLYSVSGDVKRPGSYEIPMGKVTLRQLIDDYAGGPLEGRKVKAVVPGGSSTPVLTADELDVAMDFDSLAKKGSMLGSAGTIVMDDTRSMVWATRNLAYFYKHESCGKCSPCREGTGWLLRLLLRLEAGQGEEKDLDILAKVKAVVPGGSSTPVLTADELDVAMDFESLAKKGSMLGSAGTIVMDDTRSMVWATRNLVYFYKHESCGKCSPCREGTGWLLRLLLRLEAGQGEEKDLDILAKVCDSIAGKTLCPFGDAAITPVLSMMAKFRPEFEYYIREKGSWTRVARTFAEALALSPAGAAR